MKHAFVASGFAMMMLMMMGMGVGMHSAKAAMPHTISYQGVLRDATEAPVPDGSYVITMKLYNIATGGTALWQETDTLDVKNCTFHTLMGDGNALTLDFDQTYWLGLSVDGGAEMTPRVVFSAAPYAMRAAIADSVAGSVGSDGDWVIIGSDMHSGVSGNVGIGTTTPLAKLEVRGAGESVRASGATTQFPERWIAMEYHPSVGPLLQGGGDFARLTLDANQGEAGKIVLGLQGDKVGIGTIDPGTELDVNGDIRASGSIYGTVDNADKVDNYHAGNSSGQVAVSNGTKCTNLNADQIDGYDAGNSAGQIPVSNGSNNSNLSADMVDANHVISRCTWTAGSNDYIVNTSWVKIYGYGTNQKLKIENPSGSGYTIRYVYSTDFGAATGATLTAGSTTIVDVSGKYAVDIRVMRHSTTSDSHVCTYRGVNAFNGYIIGHVIYDH